MCKECHGANDSGQATLRLSCAACRAVIHVALHTLKLSGGHVTIETDFKIAIKSPGTVRGRERMDEKNEKSSRGFGLQHHAYGGL